MMRSNRVLLALVLLGVLALSACASGNVGWGVSVSGYGGYPYGGYGGGYYPGVAVGVYGRP